jgi:hypothetical protein
MYMSGRIKDNPMYLKEFKAAEEPIRMLGYVPVSPTCLPQVGFTWEQYLHIDIAILGQCDAICLLDGWDLSEGARKEYSAALEWGKEVYTLSQVRDAVKGL